MKILLTGHTGYIGSHLLPKIIEYWPDANILVCDAKVGQDYTRLEGFNFDYVFHLGAISTIADSIELADKMMAVNALNLITFFKNNKVGKFIFSSTGAVYGERKTPALETDFGWNFCISPYAQSKYIAEGIICRMQPNHFIARFGNVYGGDVSLRVEMLSLTHFQRDNPIIVNGGDQVRDFIHVNLICEALIKAADSDIIGIYNLAHGKSSRIGDIAEKFGKEREVKVVYKPARKEDVVHTVLDVTKARNAGLIPQEIPIIDYRS